MKKTSFLLFIIFGLSIQLFSQSASKRSQYTKDYKNKFYLLGGIGQLDAQDSNSFSSIHGEMGGIFMFQKESFTGLFAGINWTIISVDYFNEGLTNIVNSEFAANENNIMLGTHVGPEIVYVPFEKFAIQGGYQIGLFGYVNENDAIEESILTSLSHSFHVGIKLGPILAKVRWQLLNDDTLFIESETVRSLNIGFVF